MLRFKKLAIIGLVSTGIVMCGYESYVYAHKLQHENQKIENVKVNQPKQDTKEQITKEEIKEAPKQEKKEEKQEKEEQQKKQEIEEKQKEDEPAKKQQKEEKSIKKQQEPAKKQELREEKAKKEVTRREAQKDITHIYNHPCNNVNNQIGNLGGVDCAQAIEVTPAVLNLTKQIVGDTESQPEQARKIYDWITSNISYNNSYERKCGETNTYGDGCNPNVVISKRNTICYGYCNLFMSMCRAVGIPCQMIYGTYHSDNGNWNPHCWNKVLINGKWIKVDPTIGRLYNCYGTGSFDNRHRENRLIISVS